MVLYLLLLRFTEAEVWAVHIRNQNLMHGVFCGVLGYSMLCVHVLLFLIWCDDTVVSSPLSFFQIVTTNSAPVAINTITIITSATTINDLITTAISYPFHLNEPPLGLSKLPIPLLLLSFIVVTTYQLYNGCKHGEVRAVQEYSSHLRFLLVRLWFSYFWDCRENCVGNRLLFQLSTGRSVKGSCLFECCWGFHHYFFWYSNSVAVDMKQLDCYYFLMWS